jgi:hypothetical protein
MVAGRVVEDLPDGPSCWTALDHQQRLDRGGW